MTSENKNNLEINIKKEGNERRIEFMNEPLMGGSFMPLPVVYEDIDKSFKEWVQSLTIVADDGREFPTFSLYSNQRFSEYMQSWQYTDSNNNLLLNFKTVSRENNPKYGKIQGGYYNIPSDIFFTMKNERVLDDNGSESMVRLEMKQPTAVDIMYSLSIFTTKFQLINDFNIMINKKFNARQDYIAPNGYYMPMTLEDISDESQYNIDDRQFYSQTFKIKVMGYVITKDDFRYTEVPIKSGVTFENKRNLYDTSVIEIEEFDNENGEISADIVIQIPANGGNISRFTSDIDFTCEEVTVENILNSYRIFINSEEVDKVFPLLIKNNDEVKFTFKRRHTNYPSKILLKGKV